MYNPEQYLTIEVLAEILSEFAWPAPYTLEGDLPDGIMMCFPNGKLYFKEGFESDMALAFSTEATQTEYNLTLGHDLSVMVPEAQREGKSLCENLINDDSPYASLAKVQNGIRDLCTLALTYLQPCMLGDFSWVEKYKETIQNKLDLAEHGAVGPDI